MYDLVQARDSDQMNTKQLSRVALTPRSVEAFNRSGVLPAELAVPHVGQFMDGREKSPELAHIKLEAAH